MKNEIEKKVNDLINKLPKNALISEMENQINLQMESITFSGVLLGEMNKHLVIKNGNKKFEIVLEDIVSIQESDSKPALEGEIIYIKVQVNANSIVRQIIEQSAKMFGTNLGKRPFVYEIPSDSKKFSVSKIEYDEKIADWAKRAGFNIPVRDQDTFVTTYSPTTKQTSSNTNSSTVDPDGSTRTDSQTDWETDSFSDPSLDIQDDPDPSGDKI